MRFWLVSFILIFAFAQFLLWVKNFFLPLPLYIFGGAFLAIASNYEQNIIKIITAKTGNLFKNQTQSHEE